MREEDEEKEWIGLQMAYTTSPVTAHNVFTLSGKWGLYQVLEKGDSTSKYTSKPDDLERNIIRQGIIAVPPPPTEMQHMQVERAITRYQCAAMHSTCLLVRAAEFLEECHADTKIPIFAYDPTYTDSQMRLFAHVQPPTTVVSTPHECLSILPHSLVVSCGLPRTKPALEIMADMLFPSGPAAILTHELQEAPWHAGGKAWLLNARIPRVAKMLEQYEVEWTGQFINKDADPGRADFSWLRQLVWSSRKKPNLRDWIPSHARCCRLQDVRYGRMSRMAGLEVLH